MPLTDGELQKRLREELKSLASNFDNDDYVNAIGDAKRDTGFSTFTTDFQIKWIKERAKRHLFFYLYSVAASKFKYKQVNLQHRFEHYGKIIDSLDKQFEKVLEEEPHLFVGASVFELFGSKIDAGFASEPQTGRDITYDGDQRVIVTPSDSD